MIEIKNGITKDSGKITTGLSDKTGWETIKYLERAIG